MDGNLLWVASQQDIIAFDISNTVSPKVINTEKTTQWAMAVDAGDGYAFVGDWGYLSIFAVDEAASGGDLHLASTKVFMQEGATSEVVVRNVGNDPVVVYNGSVSHTGLQAYLSDKELAVGESAVLEITQNSEEGGRICISSSDADTPLQYIDVVGLEDYPIGTIAPEFSLTGLDGTIFQLSEWYGSYVVLVYFATW